MITAILCVLALFVVQTLLPASFRYLLAGAGTIARLRSALGPRDEQPEMPVLGARAARALANMQEALPVFVTLALLHVLRGTAPGVATTGAFVFLGARIVYVAAYLSGVPGVRSVVWMVAAAGLVLMAWPLLA